MQAPIPARTLIVRLGAMGDILHALPAVSALRAAHPEMSLGWACEPQWRALFVADSAAAPAPRTPPQPLIDHLHLIPAKTWAKHPLRSVTLAQILACRRELQHTGYDAALDLQGAVRSAMVARWARPRRLLGEAAPREAAARWLFRERIPSHALHVIEQAADVTSALTGKHLPLSLPLLPRDPVAQRWCRDAGADAANSVLLHPGAGWGAKRWPPELFADAAARIAEQAEIRILINAAPGELLIAERLAAHLRARGADPLVLSPTVGQLIELTRLVTLVIGGDTGPLHLAAALGKPTVAIFGPTDPARNGPYHGDFRIFRDPLSRRDHTRRAQPDPGLLRIDPHAVALAAVELLQAQVRSLTPAAHA